MDAAAAPATFAQVLRNRQFLSLWLAHFVSTFGDWLAILALFSLIAFRWHGTPNQVGGIFVAFILPWSLLGPFAGVFVDRWNLKATMISSDLIRAGLAALLALATQPYQVYALMAALSGVSCFFMPAQSAMIPLLVRKEELLVANSANAQTMQLNKVISPAIAGVLVAWAGENLCFYLDSLSFVVSALFLSRLAVTRAASTEPAEGLRALVAELRAGLAYLHGHLTLRFVVLAMTAAMFIVGAFNALIAVYVRDTLHADSRIFGALTATIGIGTIAGSILIVRVAQKHSRALLVVWGICGMGVGVYLLAVSSVPWVAVGWSLALGVSVGLVLVPSQTLIQEETPREMLGRVSSSSLSLMTVAQLVGVAVAGKAADRLGIRNLYQLLALLLVFIAVVGYSYARRIRPAGEPVPTPEPEA